MNPRFLKALLPLTILAVGASLYRAQAAPSEAPQVRTSKSKNAQIVARFYEEVFNRHHVDFALKGMRRDYIQHNPYAASGREAFLAFFRAEYKAHPESRARIVRIVAEDDLVVVHAHWTTGPEDRGRAVVDILRLENGQLAEHWDVVQSVPETSANTNGMFGSGASSKRPSDD